MLPKPDSCRPCPLFRTGQGFVPRAGALSPPRRLAFIAEAAGRNEEAQGVPLVGEAGVMFNRMLQWLSLERSRFLLHNTLSCRPPSNDLLGAPYEREALDHCRPNLDSTLALGPDVVVSLGAVATRELLGLHQTKFLLKDWHGTVNRDPSDRFWVVPSFHPAHLVRGAQALTGVCLFDIRTALEVAEKGWTRQEPRRVVDPPVEWFSRWVRGFLAATAGQEEFYRLSADTETEDKLQDTDEGDLAAVQTGQRITRVNFAIGPEEGLTVPYEGAYIPWIVMLLAAPHPKLFWNKPYDLGQFRAHGVAVAGVCLDMMWAWHVLQSDVPRGLGFVGPFYLPWKSPWKHLSSSDPGGYGAWDGVNNWVIGSGVEQDLQGQGMWGVFYHHIHEPDLYLFSPSTEVGLLVDQEQLGRFGEEVKEKAAGLLLELQDGVPEIVRPLHPKGGWKSDPGPVKPNPEFEEDGENPENQTSELIPRELEVMSREETALVQVCLTCGEAEVPKTHRCKREGKIAKDLEPRVVQDERVVRRWYVRRLFNPGSSKQMLGLIAAWKYRAGENKDGRPSADKLSVEGCIRQAARKGNSTHAQWFRRKLAWGEYGKVHANYVKGTFRRLKTDPRSRADGRLHPEVTHAPSTLRTSYRRPNLQNVIAHKDLAAGFRRCLIAEERSVLAEIDFSGIEAVVTGWLAGDPQYIRLAKLGVHAYLCSYLVKEPADLRWPDSELAAYLKSIKNRFPGPYDKAKRCVHGTNYGLTPYGMNERFPEIYPTVRAAQEVQELYFHLCPKLRAWQESIKRFAARHHYVGGGGTDQVGSHPFGYRHWFWDVVRHRRITESAAKKRERLGQPWFKTGDGACFAPTDGEDAKRVVAFKPQSIARGIIIEAGLRLFAPGMPNYIGEAWKGRTPLRAMVHDSLLLELEQATRDEVLEKVVLEMRREVRELPLPPEWGMGEYLSIGVAAKVGPNWYDKDMQEWTGNGGVLGPLEIEETTETRELRADLAEAMQEPESDPEEEGWVQSERERWTERALVG